MKEEALVVFPSKILYVSLTIEEFSLKDLRKKYVLSKTRDILSSLSFSDRKEVLRTLLTEIEKYSDRSIDGRQLLVPAYFTNLLLAVSDESYEMLIENKPVRLAELIDSVRDPSLGYID